MSGPLLTRSGSVLVSSHSQVWEGGLVRVRGG